MNCQYLGQMAMLKFNIKIQKPVKMSLQGPQIDFDFLAKLLPAPAAVLAQYGPVGDSPGTGPVLNRPIKG